MITSLSRPPFINQLQSKLLNEALPGPEAHQAMAHAVRKVDPWQSFPVKKEAGVLIILFEKTPDDYHIVFIRRGSGHDQDKHAGQIGFPGGKRESADRDLMYTALREAEEEISVDLTKIDVLGALTPLYITVSKFLVHPFVAYSHQPPILTRQESEIEEIIDLPLSEIRVPSAKQQTRIVVSPGIILNHVPCFQINQHIIWGATAMILNEMLEIMTFA